MNRQRFYRVTTELLDGLAVLIQPENGPSAHGLIVDLSSGGVGVELLRPADIPLELGEPVELRISGGQLTDPMVLPATTRFYADVNGVARYGFSFRDPGSLDRQIPQMLRSFLNRREMFRVRPPASAPIWVSLSDRDGEVEAAEVEMVDISGGGMAFFIGLDDERRFATTSGLRVNFRLPTAAQKLSLAASVRYRRRLKGHWRYGVVYDRSHTAYFQLQQNWIVAYVFRRQRELLQL